MKNHFSIGLVGSYSFRANMFTTSFVLLSFALFSAKSVSSQSYFTKCCPPGQLYFQPIELSNVTNVKKTLNTCVSVPNNTMELYFFNSNVTAQLQKQPSCGYQKIWRLNKVDKYLKGSACLEVIYNQKYRRSIPLIYQCLSKENRHGSVEAVNVSVPQITYINKCCPNNTTFDRRTKACVFSSNDAPSLPTFLRNETVDEDRVMIITKGLPICQGPIADYEIDKNDVFFWNGTDSVMIPTFKHDSIDKEEYFVTKDNACFDMMPHSASNRKLIVRVCRDREYCDRNPCIRKCCAEDQFRYPKGCVRIDEGPTRFYSAFVNATQSSTFDITKDYGLLIGSCMSSRDNWLTESLTKEKWWVTSQGQVELENNLTYNLDQYCMDIYNESFELFICSNKIKSSVIKSYNAARLQANTVLQFTSCVFLLIILLVYAFLPNLRNIHGKTLMCYVSSLFFAFTCLIIIPTWIMPYRQYDIEKRMIMPYKVLAYMMLFFLLSAFSWLNVMCFDIWWTFGNLHGDMILGRRSQRRRFMLYSLYAWSFPFLMTILAIIFDYVYIQQPYLQINFGVGWLTRDSNSNSKIIFFIGPITIQLIFNVVFFVLTSKHYNQVNADIKRVILDVADPRNKLFHFDRNRFIMNIKLFIVMGMSWVFEVMSFFLKRYHVEWQDTIFYVTDVFNSLQGVLIFIVFILKNRVYRELRRQLGLNVKEKRAYNNITLRDPYRARKSVSDSTIASTVLNSAP